MTTLMNQVQGTSLGSGPRRQETMGDTIAQTGFENVSKLSNDLLLARGNTLRSGEDSMKLKELMELCTNFQNRVIDLEKTKTSQAQEITSLKRRVKRLEKKGGSRTHGLKRLYKVGLSRRVEYYDEEDMFGVNNLEGDEVIVETKFVHEVVVKTEVASKDVNLSVDEVTLAQALATLKSAKPKADKDQAPTPTVSSQQPSQFNVQDKGKGKMVKPEHVKKLSKKDQLMLDEELAFKLQAKEEEEEEERLAREKAQQIEEANIVSWDNVQAMVYADYQIAQQIKEVSIAWDNVQARVEADYQLAQRLQAQELEELTNEEKARLFVQLLEARKKYFVKLFDKAMKRVNTYVDMDTELVEDSEVRTKGSETRTEGSSKRAREDLQ
ncbi:hypothetical protein Tco_0618716 [Tanacetum coccineum]